MYYIVTQSEYMGDFYHEYEDSKLIFLTQNLQSAIDVMVSKLPDGSLDTCQLGSMELDKNGYNFICSCSWSETQTFRELRFYGKDGRITVLENILQEKINSTETIN